MRLSLFIAPSLVVSPRLQEQRTTVRRDTLKLKQKITRKLLV